MHFFIKTDNVFLQVTLHFAYSIQYYECIKYFIEKTLIFCLISLVCTHYRHTG